MRALNLTVARGELQTPRKATFAALFTLAMVMRALLVAIVPLQANDILGDAQKVSVLYFVVGLAGLAGSLSVPVLVTVFSRRWVYTAGAVSAIAAAFLFSTYTMWGLAAGLFCQVVAVAATEITLNLFLMDHIPRKELSRFEPVRIFSGAVVWFVAPWLGVFLKNEVAPGAPYLLAAGVTTLALAFFWFLRFKQDPAVQPMKRRPVNPFKFIGRFFRQPRLTLAWSLALGRSGWWSMFFVYAPIYVTEQGFGETLSGAIVSLGMGFLFLVPLWGRLGQKWGLRRLLLLGYVLTALATMSIAFADGHPWVAVGLLIFATFSATIIDGAGNVPFLRAVHPYERAEMTAVFDTFRVTGQLAPPAVFSVILKSFELSAVFVAGGAGMLVLGWLSRYIPRRL